MAASEEIFEFKTTGLSDVVNAYRQIEQAQKSIEAVTKQATAILERQDEAISQLVRSSQDLAKSNTAAARSFASVRSALSDQLALERQLAQQIRATNSAYQSRSSSNATDPLGIADSLTDSITNSIQKGFENLKQGNILGTLGNIVAAPFSAIGSVASGALSGIGFGLVQSVTAPIGAKFGQGLSNALENSLSNSVGSSELLAEKVGGAIGTAITGAASSRLQNLPDILEAQIARIDDKDLRKKLENVLGQVREAPGQIRQSVTDTIGQDSITREGLATRASQQQARTAQTPQIREQAVQEWRQAIEQLNRVETAATQRLSALEQQIQERQSEFNQAQQRYQQINQRLEQAQQSGQSTIAISEIAEELRFAGQDLQQLSQTITALTQSRQIATRAVEEARQASTTARSRVEQVLPQRQSQAFVDVAQATLGDVDPEKLPRLVVNDALLKSQNAASLYQPALNAIVVTSQMLEAIQNNSLTEKQIRVLSEELAHAQDFDFGSAKGIDAARQNRVVSGRQVQATPEELARLAPEVGRYSAERRNVELNAKVQANRATDRVLQQRSSEEAFQQITDIAAQQDIAPVKQQFLNAIKLLQRVATEQGIDLTGTIAQYIQIYEQQFSKVKAVSEKAAQQAATATEAEIAQLQAELQQANTAVKAVITSIIGKIEKLKNPEPLQIPLNLPQQKERELVEVEPRQQSEKLARRQDQPTFRERATSVAEGAGQAARSVAEGAQKTVSVIRQVGESLQAPASALIQGAGIAAKATVSVAKTGYKVAEAMEGLALDIVPAGRTMKAIGKNVALPAAAFGAATAFLPGGTAAVASATQLASSALVPLGNAAASGAAGAIAGAVPNVLGLQGAITGAVTAGIDVAVAGASVVLAKTGVAVVGGRTVAALAGRTARVVTDAVSSAIDQATNAVDEAKVKTDTAKSRVKNRGAIEVAATPVADEIGQADRLLPEPKATKAQIDAAIAQAKNLDKEFASAYQNLKKAIGANDDRLAQAYQATIRDLSARAKSDVDSLIAQLKAAGDTSGAIGTLGGVKGRLTQKENLAAKEVAKYNRSREARGDDLNAQALSLSFNAIDPGLEALKRAAAKTADALNGAIAAFAEIEKQARLTDTVKAAAQTPKVQAVAKDLAVNTAGFAASSLAANQGSVAGLAADAIGALAARTAINTLSPLAQAYLELRKSVEFREKSNAEKITEIRNLIEKYRISEKQQADELFGDIVGFGIGNATAMATAAVPIPLRGAAAAMTAVPRLQGLRDRINTATREPDAARGEDLNAQALNPGQAIRALNSRRKQLLEVLEQQIGNYMDELSLRLQGQPDLIDNAKVNRTLALLNQRVERLMDERSQRIDEIDEQQFQKLIAAQRTTLERINNRQTKQPNLDNLLDDLAQKEQQETLRQAQRTTQNLQRQVYESARKGLVDTEAQLPLLRVEDPAEGASLVKQLKLFYGRLNADIQENVRDRLNSLLAESQSLSADLGTSAIAFRGQGDTNQADRLGQVQQRLNNAQREAQAILIKPRVEVNDRDIQRLKDLEREIRDVYKAVSLPPPPGGGFLGDIGEDAALSGGQFGGVGAAIVGLGAGQVASQALGSTARQATATFKEFASFDQQIRTFGVVSQASQEQVTRLRTEVENLATSTTKGNREIAAAAISLAKQGFSAEQTTQALKGVVLSATASGESLEDTAKVIGSTLNQFQLDTSKSAMVADLLTQASNASATGTAQLGESLKYVGGQAKDANQSAQETITVLALMAGSGLDASAAGTGLAEALKRIRNTSASATTELTDLKSRGSKQAIAAFNLLNQEVRDSNGNLLPFTQILSRVKNGLQNFPQPERELILSALFGVQGSRAVLSVIGQTDEKIQSTISAMQKFQGSSEKAGNALTQGAAGSLERFNGALENLRIQAGETAAIAFVPLLNAANALLDGFSKLDPNVQKIIIAVGGLATTLAAGTLAIAAFQVANASFIGTIVRSAATLAIDTAAIVARTVATHAASAAQVLFNTQVTAGTVKTAALAVANKASAVAMGAFGVATSSTATAMGVATAAAGKLGAALALAAAPLAVLGAGVALTGLVKMTEQMGDINNSLEAQRSISDTVVANSMRSLTQLASANRTVNAAREKGIALSAQEKKNAQDAIKAGNAQLSILKQQLADAEKIPQAQAGMFGIGANEAEAQNNTRQANIDGLKNQIAAIERNRDAVQKSLATDNAKTLATQQQTKADKDLVDSIKDRLDLGELTQQQAIAELEAVQANTKNTLDQRQKAKAALDKLRKEEVDNAKRSREAQLEAEITAIQAGQAQIEAQQIAGNLSEAEADKQLTALKIQEIEKRIEAARAAQESGTEEEKQKAISEEIKLQAEISKIQAEARKREQERRLKDILDANAKVEAAIQQSQTARITATREAELAALRQGGLNREQIERDTQQEISAIQLEGTNQELNAKKNALAQIQQARAAGTIDQKAAAEQEKQLITEIGQLNLQRLDAEKAALQALIQERLRALDIELQAAKLPLEARASNLGNINTLLQQQSNLLTAQQGLEQAISNLTLQRLNYALEDAKAAGNSAAAAQIQSQIFAEQAVQLEQQYQSKLAALELSEKIKANELEIAKIQSEIAVLEAEAAIKKAEAEGKSQQEIAALQQQLELKQKIADLNQKAIDNQAEINAKARQQLDVEQQAARERQQREQQKAGKELGVAPAPIASGVTSTGRPGNPIQGTAGNEVNMGGQTKRSFNLSGEQIGQYDRASQQFSQILKNSQSKDDQQIALLRQLTGGTASDEEKAFLAARAEDNGFSGVSELAKQLENVSQFDIDARIREAQGAGADILEALKTLAEGAKSAGDSLGGIPKISARRDGGSVHGGRSYLVGEAGPELITPTRGGWVHTAPETTNLLSGFVPRDIAASHHLPVLPRGDKAIVSEIRAMNDRIDDLVKRASYPRTLVVQSDSAPISSAAKVWSDISKHNLQRRGL